MTHSFDPGREEQLFEQCLAGEEQARETLCRRYEPALARRIACRVHADAQDADVRDILQDVFLSLFESNCERLRAFDPAHDRVMRFLMRQAAPHIRRWQRGDKRRRQLISFIAGEHDPEDTRWNASHDAALDQVLSVLSVEQRRLLVWTRLVCWSEPASEEKPTDAVRRRLRRLKRTVVEYVYLSL